MNLPSNWDPLESEYNRHYDPYAEKCPDCRAEDSFEQDEDDDGLFWFCRACGERMEMQ